MVETLRTLTELALSQRRSQQIKAQVSSFHVIDGTWELLGKDDGNIVVNGQTRFGPGYCNDMPFPSDKVASIKRVSQV